MVRKGRSWPSLTINLQPFTINLQPFTINHRQISPAYTKYAIEPMQIGIP